MYTVSLSILCNICPQLRGRRGFDICHKMSHVTLAHTRVRETLSARILIDAIRHSPLHFYAPGMPNHVRI